MKVGVSTDFRKCPDLWVLSTPTAFVFCITVNNDTHACLSAGYDQAYNPGEIVQADPDEAVRSLTGEYCLRQGIYSRTKPSNLTELPGEPCNRIEKITCIRWVVNRPGGTSSDAVVNIHMMWMIYLIIVWP